MFRQGRTRQGACQLGSQEKQRETKEEVTGNQAQDQQGDVGEVLVEGVVNSC